MARSKATPVPTRSLRLGEKDGVAIRIVNFRPLARLGADLLFDDRDAARPERRDDVDDRRDAERDDGIGSGRLAPRLVDVDAKLQTSGIDDEVITARLLDDRTEQVIDPERASRTTANPPRRASSFLHPRQGAASGHRSRTRKIQAVTK